MRGSQEEPGGAKRTRRGQVGHEGPGESGGPERARRGDGTAAIQATARIQADLPNL